jgi:hypothetical protein
MDKDKDKQGTHDGARTTPGPRPTFKESRDKNRNMEHTLQIPAFPVQSRTHLVSALRYAGVRSYSATIGRHGT